MQNLSNSSVLITGLARNCAASLVQEISSLASAFSSAKKIQFFIVESDSTDDTCLAMGKLASIMYDFHYISLGKLQNLYTKRTERLAYLRNLCVREITVRKTFGNVEYVVVADLDGVNSKLSQHSVLSCWTRSDWDVCTAKQNGYYYDIWALRHKYLSPNDCWRQVRCMRVHGFPAWLAVLISVSSRMFLISSNSKWIKVDSAFGGLAIYRYEAFADMQYVGLSELGEQVCEHVYGHLQLTRHGKTIFINPELINCKIVEHTISLASLGGFARFVFVRVLKSKILWLGLCWVRLRYQRAISIKSLNL